MSLTAKQARFAEEYVLDHNATAAALRAGFAPNSARVTACRLLKANRAVQAAVAAQEALVAAEMGVSRQRVLRELQEAVELARLKSDPAAMIAGWREIGRMCGFYAPEKRSDAVKRVETIEGWEGRLNRMSEAELLRLIEGGGETVGAAA